MSAQATVGTLCKWSYGVEGTPITNPLEFNTFTLAKHQNILSTDGIRGTRSHPVERTILGTYTCSGQIGFNPGQADLITLLPYILGSGNVLTEANTFFSLEIDRQAAASNSVFNHCVVDKAVFKGSQGGLIDLTLDIEAQEEIPLAALTEGAAVPSLNPPLVFQLATCSIAGTPYQFRSVSLTIDNHILKDRFMNSVTRTSLPALDRTVTVDLELPFTGDTIALYDPGATSAVVALLFSDGTNTMTFTLNAVQFPTAGITTPGRGEIMLPYNGIARKTGTTLELVMTHS